MRVFFGMLEGGEGSHTKNGGNTAISNKKAQRHERKVEKDREDYCLGVFRSESTK